MSVKDYLSNRVATANDAELVAILFEGLIETLQEGMTSIESNDDVKLDYCIDKSKDILAELLSTLVGDSEIANNLRSLYVYVNKLMTEAHIKKDATKLQGAIKVVTPLHEAWKELAQKEFEKGVDTQGPAIVAGVTYGKGQLKDYVMNDDERWKKG